MTNKKQLINQLRNELKNPKLTVQEYRSKLGRLAGLSGSSDAKRRAGAAGGLAKAAHRRVRSPKANTSRASAPTI